ncbi:MULTISPECIES: WecB/TagA/CpsF family glycosyltransferase [unclassified Meiothermus]|uniref:WecB/TagA/CpsF family glycosyltransferase n=1 Tax=unclassified Meiothermus TaxID=370471 RepID=UPI000D7C9E8D|nr:MULTISPECIES: WecB/TagA/CpsF family glycosyltransferase [unclassified Meiothermus]PZA08251.1 glycosyltransferase [Meiothermus sp. Pnk-1]RYM38993.1 glycosyltransferase [Meiothermus sp. PNK-Is4]
MKPERISLVGLPLDLVNMSGALEVIEGFLQTSGPTRQVLTLNPEIVVRAQSDPAVRRAILEAELVTADGVGILWAAKRLTGKRLEERVTGADLTVELFKRFGPRLRVFFLGARPGIAQKAAERSRREWGIQVVGTQDGYFQDEAAVLEAIRQSQPDLLLVGMGERQDTFIHRNKANLGAKVAIGVGGVLDVLSGEVRRVPVWAQRLNIEWLLRVGLDRKRWGRFPRLIRFVRLVWAAKKARA